MKFCSSLFRVSVDDYVEVARVSDQYGWDTLMLSDHVGFRFEGRIFVTDVDDDHHHRHCDPYDCYGHSHGYGDGTSLVQATLGAGLVLAF